MAHSSEHADEQTKICQEAQPESDKPSTTPDSLSNTRDDPLCQPGYPELEYSEADDESDLQVKRENCKKNPGHTKFIPVNEFKMEHLPDSYHNEMCADQIQTVIDVTVGVNISFTSRKRPDDKSYSRWAFRGKGCNAHGTGLICRVVRPYKEINDETCVCHVCRLLPQEYRKKQWGEFIVRTAMHVVYNDEVECKYTKFLVDYNTDADRDTCPKLYGVETDGASLDTDVCHVVAVSHDKDLSNMLEKRVNRFKAFPGRKSYSEIPAKREANDMTRAIICVSHPHGMSKHVSIGEWRGEEEKDPYRWRYTTATCPGSSGAPIFELGDVNNKPPPGDMTTHWGARNDSENESGWEGEWWA